MKLVKYINMLSKFSPGHEIQSAWTHMAIPIPPPIQRDTTPFLAARLFMAWRRVTSTRQPEAPMG